jgi:hypothetical protein
MKRHYGDITPKVMMEILSDPITRIPSAGILMMLLPPLL